MLQNNVFPMHIGYCPLETLLLNETEVKTSLAIVDNLTEFPICILIIHASSMNLGYHAKGK
jgi:hypothetical protein